MPTHSAPVTDVLAYCRAALPSVSRTFALTIPILREPLQTEVAVCYLIFRAADTVEDHPDLRGNRRDALLSLFLDHARRPNESWSPFLRQWPAHPDAAHQDLMEHLEDLFRARAALPQSSQHALDASLEEMLLGMLAFPTGDPKDPAFACPDVKSLDVYCHAVAGTVGLLLSRLFSRGIDDPRWLDPTCAERGRRLGLGLQLTNILKDHLADTSRGVSYVPPEWLRAGENGAVLSDEGREAGVQHALRHLDEGTEYILGIPPVHTDMRLFCVLAHHLALATLAEVIHPEGRRPPKISRDAVLAISAAARATHADDRALRTRTKHLRDQIPQNPKIS